MYLKQPLTDVSQIDPEMVEYFAALTPEAREWIEVSREYSVINSDIYRALLLAYVNLWFNFMRFQVNHPPRFPENPNEVH